MRALISGWFGRASAFFSEPHIEDREVSGRLTVTVTGDLEADARDITRQVLALSTDALTWRELGYDSAEARATALLGSSVTGALRARAIALITARIESDGPWMTRA